MTSLPERWVTTVIAKAHSIERPAYMNHTEFSVEVSSGVVILRVLRDGRREEILLSKGECLAIAGILKEAGEKV
jgi:hypothetical protein